MFIYLQNKIFYDKYEKVFKEGGITMNIELPLLGNIANFHKMPKESLEKMKNSTHYKYCVAVMKKLQPIVDLIEDVNPDLYQDMVKTVERGDISR
jgi:hypothetical protein